MSAGGLREAGFRPPRFGQSEAGSGRKQSSGPLETSCRAIRYRNPPCVLRREGLCRRFRDCVWRAAVSTHNYSISSINRKMRRPRRRARRGGADHPRSPYGSLRF